LSYPELSLSAAVIVGPCRNRGQRVVTALCTQSAIESMEVIIVDLSPDDTPNLVTPDNIRVKYLHAPELHYWSRARMVALVQAEAPVIAYIEDHCYPSPCWAEALIKRHKENWVAVGYAFVNANPDTWISRGAMVNDYGDWMDPAPTGPLRLLPGNNISYKREILLSFGSELEELLTPDFALQEVLWKRGLPMCLEPRAHAAHENWNTLPSLLRSNHDFSRLLGARRAKTQSWKRWKCLFYAFVTPFSSPILAVIRLFGSLSGRTSLLSQFLEALPVVLLNRFWCGVGEALGYLLGEGQTLEKVNQCEIIAVRSTKESS